MRFKTDIVADLSLPDRTYDQATLRRFLDCVSSDDDPAIAKLRTLWNSAGSESLTNVEAAQLIRDAILRFLDLYEGNFVESWRRRAQSVLGTVMQSLGEHPSGIYPQFNPKSLPTIKTITRPAKSLATLGFPELERYHPSNRDEVGLRLVREEAVKAFERAEAIFAFGQTVLESPLPPDDVNPEAWTNVKTLLTSLYDELRLNGRSGRSHVYKYVNKASDWVYAGLPKHCVDKAYMEGMAVHELALSCLGATRRTTTAVKVIFCIETRWNREQIETLPANPYAFRLPDVAGLGEAAFLSAYKARAHHLVSAFLERGYREYPLHREHLLQIWGDERREQEYTANSELIYEQSTLEILDRYSILTKQVRDFPDTGPLQDNFFVSIGTTSHSDTTEIRRANIGPLLSRTGVTYGIIRQSGINTKRRLVGSLESTRHFSNHSRTGILISHYNDEVQQRDLDEGIRFWQNCIQATIVSSNKKLSKVLFISSEDIEWFTNLSKAAGISTCLGITSRRLKIHGRNYIKFIPSPENLAELYSIRLALFSTRKRLGAGRWTIQALPILAFILAIRRQIYASGLGPQYIFSCREVFLKLRSGAFSLPRIFEL